MCEGRNKTICGKIINSPVVSRSIKKKGMTLRKPSSIGMLTVRQVTNTLAPTGGVIRAISTILVTRIPNQMGLKPKVSIIGKTKGKVITIIPIPPIKQPKMI